MKAPNGKPSNLTPEQWKLVRTPQFKAWFGDWENDPENASKVVDENGEPLVVYHGTNSEFYYFDKNSESNTYGTSQGFQGFFFTKSKGRSGDYALSKEDLKGGDAIVISAFLSLKNPNIKDAKNQSWVNVYPEQIDNSFDNKNDGVITYNILDGATSYSYWNNNPDDNYIAFEPNQIKLADGSNTTFDGNNPDIRFAEGGKTKRYMKKIKRGGITYGKSHAEGGIPVKNQSTGDMLEVEGGEGIVNKRSMASDKMVKLNGKEMTICEAVSQLNQLEGGVQFSCDDVSDRQFIEAMAKGGELERGTRTEQEHIQVLRDLYAKRITPKQASKRIAKDHLKEDSRYYSKLAKMEGKMAKGGMSEDLSIYIDYDKTKLGEYEKVENMSTLKSLAKNGFIELSFNTGKDKIKIDKPSSKGIYFERNTYKNREIDSAVKPKFTFNGKEFFIGYQKGINYLEFYVLQKGEDWDKYNTQEKMAKGGEIFDKETEDFLSDLTKKYAKGGEVVADKTETINMKDFEGYADQYNGRKNKFFKANDEYQLLVNEGMELKNNTTLPQEDKDRLLAELREKAREAKTNLGEKRKDLVDMREVKSPFYAPQLADGGIFTSLPKAVRVPHELKEIVKSKSEFPIDTEYQFYISKSERFPKIITKGISAKFKLVTLKEGLSTRIYFSISSKATYEKDDNGVWENVAKTLQIIPSLKNDISSIAVNKIARGYDVYFFITKPLSYIDIYNITANVVQNLIDYQSFLSLQKLFKKGEETIPPTEKEDDWNWRFKTYEELKAELGGDLHALKDGNVFAISMRYLLGKKINETQEAVEAISKINQKTYGGVETLYSEATWY